MVLKMKKLLIGLILKFGKSVLINVALKELEGRKHAIITTINQRIDIPGHDEAREEKIYKTIYDVVLDILKGL